MEAYIKEVRKLEESFDKLQTKHVPRSIADHLSKYVAQKLPVEPETFVLHPTQTSVSPTKMAIKRRKLDSGKPLAELPEAPDRELGGNNFPSNRELHPPARPPLLAVKECAPMNEVVLPVLVVEPLAPTWARHIVHFLQTGELPEEQEEAKRVAGCNTHDAAISPTCRSTT